MVDGLQPTEAFPTPDQAINFLTAVGEMGDGLLSMLEQPSFPLKLGCHILAAMGPQGIDLRPATEDESVTAGMVPLLGGAVVAVGPRPGRSGLMGLFPYRFQYPDRWFVRDFDLEVTWSPANLPPAIRLAGPLRHLMRGVVKGLEAG